MQLADKHFKHHHINLLKMKFLDRFLFLRSRDDNCIFVLVCLTYVVSTELNALASVILLKASCMF